ncbi:MAG: hypothetical protein R3C56_07425 [Pirellulaceae bacterium]
MSTTIRYSSGPIRKSREEINKLLVKLGELPPEGGSRSPFRTIDAARLPETYEYLDRIRKQWALMSDVPLELPAKELFDTNEASDKKEASGKKEASAEQGEAATEDVAPEGDSKEPPKSDATPASDKVTGLVPLGKLSQTRAANPFTAAESPTADVHPDESADKANRSKSPIRIALDPQGNLILYSEDLEALNALETLMSDIAPPARPYHVVKVEHQTATWITFDLEDYFKDLAADEEKEQDPRAAYYSYIFGMETGQTKKKTPAQLGRKRPLRFIPNNDTQTILVIGADAATIETVERLVELWDVPDKVDDSRVRLHTDRSHQVFEGRIAGGDNEGNISRSAELQ